MADHHQSFTELMLDRTRQAPDRDALVLLPESDERGRAVSVSYRALDAAARELAGWLQERGAAGERVLLLHGSRRQFAVSFLACLYSGAIAVPVPVTGGRGHHEERVTGIVKESAPCAVLTDAALAPDVSRLLALQGHGHVLCLAADAVPGHTEWRLPDLDRDTIAYLQYTSGSTGSPRGVVVTHGNLLANQESLGRLLGTGPGARIGGWLPLHHDMGLVGQLLHPLWLGGTSVLLKPEAFVKRPVRWLEAVSRYGIEVSGAPDFAYELCVRRITDEQLDGLDLSRWRVAVSGGEPVSPRTLRSFHERFASAGLRPGTMRAAYGLAEATLIVTGGPAPDSGADEELTVDAESLEQHKLRGPRPGKPVRTLVSCGTPDTAATTVRIVDPETLEEVPDGKIGEIWVAGPGVAQGYWRDRAATAERFEASTGGAGCQLRTGDLGVLHHGSLHVTGRLRDMIVVAGRNLYPQDLEHAVQRISTLFGTGTAFAVPAERERVVVVQELRTHERYALDLEAVAKDVQRCLAEEFDIAVGGVLLVRPGTVRRTTSGKVERAAMRRLFLSGGIQPLYQHLDKELMASAGSSR
ncbi:fatty acyl-AMP ligase [Streptomyces sp. ICC1]|uniref:fatty acyl-AMP ligase n=2 Tax=unclassified Streptomyces TaxID=2593676 RepID=UPI000DC76EEF|nr:fatty acyl-AMP ligase [Streptomyces sp. ICC1]AWZ04432.1 polyketide synthase [Streptomyces sp. ICC4]AWZ12052.1 polyketide synthase [Streptomyces sp. ICC1]